MTHKRTDDDRDLRELFREARRADSLWPGVTKGNPRYITPIHKSPNGATERPACRYGRSHILYPKEMWYGSVTFFL